MVPRLELNDAVMTYARDVAGNDPQQMRLVKQAVNQVQDAQGFTAGIQNSHAMYMSNWQTERDPGFALGAPKGRRRPMVQVALERYRRDTA